MFHLPAVSGRCLFCVLKLSTVFAHGPVNMQSTTDLALLFSLHGDV